MKGTRLREERKRVPPDEKFPGYPGQLSCLYRNGRPGFVEPFNFLWSDGSIGWVLLNSKDRPFPAIHLRAAPASEKMFAPVAVQLDREIEMFSRMTGAPPPDPVIDTLFATFWNTEAPPGDEAVAKLGVEAIVEPGVDLDSLKTENTREGEATEGVDERPHQQIQSEGDTQLEEFPTKVGADTIIAINENLAEALVKRCRYKTYLSFYRPRVFKTSTCSCVT